MTHALAAAPERTAEEKQAVEDAHGKAAATKIGEADTNTAYYYFITPYLIIILLLFCSPLLSSFLSIIIIPLLQSYLIILFLSSYQARSYRS